MEGHLHDEKIVVSNVYRCHSESCIFPRGSAGGPDGLRPQHLLDLTSASAEHGGRELLRSLTSFTNFVLEGNVPPFVQPIFFGDTLIPLHKKDGGIRPIAVGQTLVGKCVGLYVIHSVGTDIAPDVEWPWVVKQLPC